MTSPRGQATPLYHIYRGVTRLIAPFAWRKVAGKLRDYGLPEDRVRERMGHTSLPRPKGRLIWFHAASVGESLSVLALIRALGARDPDLQFLITSGTPTSAELVAKRMPPRCRHQFPPLDTGPAVRRFLDHWQPDLGVFVESELWPQMIVEARKADIPLVLLNARLSDRSVKGWQKRPNTARFILAQFDLFLTQNQRTADNLRAIGADPARVRPGSNLKATAAAPPVDAQALAALHAALGGRPTWIASSTHEGEEETVLKAHSALLQDHPDLCLILIPRHPERGTQVQALIEQAGMTQARRSEGALPDPGTQVYLADTLGEVGTFYALSPLVFLGGSLLEIGGHNPFEPMQCGAAVITGPGTFNFAETFADLTASGVAVEISDAEGLARQITQWLDAPDTLAKARQTAKSHIAQQSDLLDRTVSTLMDLLPNKDLADGSG